jgi:hypothetical protein
MPVCPVFAVGLEGKCDTGGQRSQGGKGRDITSVGLVTLPAFPLTSTARSSSTWERGPNSSYGDSAHRAACIDGEAIDPQLRQALQMTQRETFHATEKFGQAMTWENVHLNDVDVVDKPGGLTNASAYVGLVPAHKTGIVPLANRGDFPHEIARYRVLPELAREE